MTPIKFTKTEEYARYPTYAHENDACMDVYASDSHTLYSHEVMKVSTGIHIEIPNDCYAMVLPRSSMGLKGVIIPNAPGIIDSSYPGTLQVILMNLNPDKPIEIKRGDRIAQLQIFWKEELRVFNGNLEKVDIVHAVRAGGFGSSGD